VDAATIWLDKLHLDEVVVLELTLLDDLEHILDDEGIAFIVSLNLSLPAVERPWESHSVFLGDRICVSDSVFEPFETLCKQVK